MYKKILKIIFLVLAATALGLWFFLSYKASCDSFSYLPDGEHQNTSCTCIGKKFEFKSDINEFPGEYGTKCLGWSIFSRELN